MDTTDTGSKEQKSAKCNCDGVGYLSDGKECICRINKRRMAYNKVAGFPKIFEGPECSWKKCESKDPDVKIIEPGKGIFIFGPPTTGKTFLAVALGKLAIGKNFRVKYYSALKYFDIIRNRFDDNDSYQELRNDLEIFDIIIWDNLQDGQYNSKWEKKELSGTIRLRFDKGHADIVITDQLPDNFKNTYGESLYNYLARNCFNINTEEKVGY